MPLSPNENPHLFYIFKNFGAVPVEGLKDITIEKGRVLNKT